MQPRTSAQIVRVSRALQRVVVDGGAGASDGLQLKHADFARLLRLADSVDGWLNDTCMDYIGKLVNNMGDGAYAFSTYLQECFLMGPEKGGWAIRKVVKKVWTHVSGEGERAQWSQTYGFSQ